MPEEERIFSGRITDGDLAAVNILQDKWHVLLAESLYNSGPRRILTNAQFHLLGLTPLDRGTVVPYLGEEPK